MRRQKLAQLVQQMHSADPVGRVTRCKRKPTRSECKQERLLEFLRPERFLEERKDELMKRRTLRILVVSCAIALFAAFGGIRDAQANTITMNNVTMGPGLWTYAGTQVAGRWILALAPADRLRTELSSRFTTSRVM